MILETNAQLLEQAAEVLAGITDVIYTQPTDIFGGQRIGGHVRHIVDFYERLIAGLEDGSVNYDARLRDPLIETNRLEAIRRIDLLISQLRQDVGRPTGRRLLVAGEGAGYVESSLGRELQAVASHTVHHFALIGILLRYQGIPVPPDFGVSKATLDYREKQREAA